MMDRASNIVPRSVWFHGYQCSNDSPWVPTLALHVFILALLTSIVRSRTDLAAVFDPSANHETPVWLRKTSSYLKRIGSSGYPNRAA